MVSKALKIGCCVAAATLLSVCGDDSTSPASAAKVQVLLTDAPSDYIARAEVWISRIYLKPGGAMDDTESDEGSDEGAGSAAVDLFNDPVNPLHYDLLTLRDGLSADLTGLADVPEGSYGKLRLVVDRALVTLAEGYAFRDGSTEAPLKTPSAHKSGLKVELADVITADAGTVTVVTVDFDVDQNFKLQGNPESPAGINGVLFTPSLKELRREQNGGTGP